MNIVDPILFRCKQNPPAAALCAPGAALGLISYARLESFIHNIGHRALAEGLAAGQTVAIHVKDNILHCAILLALARIGVITFSPSTLNFPPALRVDAVITDAPATDRGPSGVRLVRVDAGWTEGP